MVGLSLRPGLPPWLENSTVTTSLQSVVQTTQWEHKAPSTVLWKLFPPYPRVLHGLIADPTARSKTSQGKGVQETWAPLILPGLSAAQGTHNVGLRFLWVIANVRREVTDWSSETSFLSWSLPVLCSTFAVCGLYQAWTWLNLGKTTQSSVSWLDGWISPATSHSQCTQFPPAPPTERSPTGHPRCPLTVGLDHAPYPPSLSLSLAQASFLSSRPLHPNAWWVVLLPKALKRHSPSFS